ncbi:hypothetical protein NM688_g5311 [Phlebia brevispora]|uniref:Uncharacterized protein n=1 Tax=Phlebia brevispora TaxID=194682 RepID=A0ACC1SXF8_9APHY|nr:hypothetical protein NM688_g5311 [Phlebia brevispora]
MPPLAEQAQELAQQGLRNTQIDQQKDSQIKRYARTILKHFKHHIGVGIVCSVAYFDPGNWSVDLQAGSQFGYRPMLFVVLLAGLGAVVLQSLASKLGCVTGMDLASHCRVLLHDRPKHRYLVRFLVLYPLYILSEIAIISTDLAELIGSAIGLCLLIPALPLWTGVLLTATDVLVFLIIGDPSRHSRPVKLFELVIMVLVFAVFASFIVLLVRIKPDWSDVFMGYIPSATLFDADTDALYTAVGILGATVMPHALFLGSFLATQDRAGEFTPTLPAPVQHSDDSSFPSRLRMWLKSLFSVTHAERIAASRDYRNKYGRENRELGFIRAHLSHGLVDIVTSLMGVAVPINSAILILAAAVFYQGGKASMTPADLFDAYDLIKGHVGTAAAVIFAIALLCAGQTASITATLAGQIVSEGFIEWRVSPFLRRLITRMIGLVPSMVVAIAVGRAGLNTLLVASQVALSVVLPFVAFPLIVLTSSKSVMRVRKPRVSVSEKPSSSALGPVDGPASRTDVTEPDIVEVDIVSHDDVAIQSTSEKSDDAEIHTDIFPVSDDDEYIDFSNGPILTTVASIIFIIILAANVYVFVVLGKGGGN